MSTPCETLRNELIDLAKGESNLEAQAHLDAGCVTCAEELEQLKTIVAVLTRMPAPVADSRERVTAAARAADWADTPDEAEAMIQVAGLLAELPDPQPEAGFAQRVVAHAQVADLMEQLPTPEPSAGAAQRVVETAQVVDLLLQLPTPQPSPGSAKRIVAAALAADAAEAATAGAGAAGNAPGLHDSGIIKLSDYFKERARKAPVWVATIAVHAAAILVLASIAIAPGSRPEQAPTVAVAPKDDKAATTDPANETDPDPGASVENVPLPGPAHIPLDPTLDERWDEFEKTDRPTIDPGVGPSGSEVSGPNRFDIRKAGRDLEQERQIRTMVAAWIGFRRGDRRAEAHASAGTTQWQASIARGLEWLRKEQEPDGSWRPSKHGGADDHRVGLTALAVLAFAAEGHCATDGDEDSLVVGRAVNYLYLQQDRASGRFGPDTRVHLYAHAIAMLAVAETHGLDILNYYKLSDLYARHYLAKAVDYVAKAQRPDGGWGYRPGASQSDTSITVWQVAALDAARRVGIEGAEAPLRRAKSWLQRVSDAQGRYGYHAAGDFPKGTPGLAAAGKWGQLLLNDEGRGDQANTARVQLLRKNLPGKIGAKSNVYAWYYGTLVMRERGGDDWAAWRDALGKTLTGAQSLDGSWPIGGDRFGESGGRLYTTAMNLLSLQAPARYSK